MQEPVTHSAPARPREHRASLAEMPRSFHDQYEQVQADLVQFIERRLCLRLRRRVEVSDILQETLLVACREFADFELRRPMPFRTWLLKTAQQQLIHAHRFHLQSQRRSVAREVIEDFSPALLDASRAISLSTPSRQLMREEVQQRVLAALAQLDETDREILVMREYERRPYDEIACLLDLEPATARKRFGRALLRLGTALKAAGVLE